MYGDGSQTRSFCYVSDLVEGFVRGGAAETFESPVNIGNPNEFSMLELARIVSKVAGVAVDFRHLPLPADDPKRRCPDISKAKRLIGFEAKVKLEDGIRQTYENFKARLDAKQRVAP